MCGGFVKGNDQEVKNPKYMMVGVYTVPVFEDDGTACSSPKEEDILAVRELDLHLRRRSFLHQRMLKNQIHRSLGRRLRTPLSMVFEGGEIHNYTMVEIVANRSQPKVQYALAKMFAKLNYLGLPLRRLHSDRAAEFTSSKMRRWTADRGV